MATPTDISKPYRFLNGGPLDWWSGPYANIAAANAAVPNAVDTDGVNVRMGKQIFIGTPTNFVIHAWQGGFADANLTPLLKGDKGDKGDRGWSPEFALVDDSGRRVIQLVDYVGGEGAKPTDNIGDYIGATGYTSVIANAVDIRGPQGNSGTSDIPAWASQTYESGSLVNYQGIDWIASDDTLSTDIPGVSNLWAERLYSYARKQSVDDLNKITPTQSNNNAAISSTGGTVVISGYTIKYIPVIEGQTYRITNTLSSAGATSRQHYGFYTELPVSTTSFISGSGGVVGATSIDVEVTIPSGATILAVTDTGNARIYRMGLSLLQSIIDGEAQDLTEQKITQRLRPILGYGRAIISGTTGAIVGNGSDTVGVKVYPVIPGRKYYIKSTLASTGGTTKLPYAWHTDINLNATSFISGGSASGASRSIDVFLEAPTGANYLVVGDNVTSGEVSGELVVNFETTDNPKFKRVSNNDTNLAPAPFKRPLNTRINGETSTVELISGVGSNINAVTFYDSLVETYQYATSANDLGTEYTLSRIDGVNFGTNELIFSFNRENISLNYTLTFWINVTALAGNNLIISLFASEVMLNTHLKQIGYGISAGGCRATIDEVSGDYSHIRIQVLSASNRYAFPVGVAGNGSAISSIKIIRPYVFEGTLYPDPYGKHLSVPERIYSPSIGLRAVFFGDSQLHQTQTYETMKLLGCSVHHFQEGGRSIKYNNAVSYDGNWLYHWGRLQKLNDLKGDIFVMHLSTNDGSGGGTLTDATVNAVLDNYPNINDTDPGVIAAKLSTFNAMSVPDRQAMFTYKATMGALIRQIMIKNQNARVVLCTIPFGRGSNTSYDAIRSARASKETMRAEIYDIASFFNAPVVDLYNWSGIMVENAVTMEPDGVHWGDLTRRRMGVVVARELLKVVY